MLLVVLTRLVDICESKILVTDDNDNVDGNLSITTEQWLHNNVKKKNNLIVAYHDECEKSS